MKKTAVVGLGNMGIGMAKNLIAAGFPVQGFDLRPERMDLLAELGGSLAAAWQTEENFPVLRWNLLIDLQGDKHEASLRTPVSAHRNN